MISFACKEVDLKELLMCSFELNKTSYAVMIQLLNEDRPMSAEDIAKKLHLDRTTVQKALKALIDRQIAIRKQMNLSLGGYQYFYEVKAKEDLKRRIIETIHNWTNQVEKEVRKW